MFLDLEIIIAIFVNNTSRKKIDSHFKSSVIFTYPRFKNIQHLITNIFHENITA